MSSEGEIIGEIAQGALIARAAEPAHGEAEDGHTHESACLNCGTALVGSHCHQCGQAAHVHKTLGAFFHDLLHGVFHFEGKIWRTLPLLAWNPGKLTREYIDGRRASYVSPIALFLFVVFLTFAVFNLLKSPVNFNAGSNAQAQAGFGAARVEADNAVERLEARLANARAGKGGDVVALERELKSARDAVTALEAAEQGNLPETIADADPGTSRATADAINKAWRHAKENPDLMLYKLQTGAYKYAWLVIPLSVPFLWLLFPFSRRFHLYDHTVFVTYSVSFMLILATLASLLISAEIGWLPGLLMLYSPVHMYRQARGTYQLSRFGALWRTFFLALFAQIVLILFGTILALMVASG
ncbi:DUF3667 domain-containing protein [Novosphingobium sp.]|uniref:DUF3667 domain-containing protein n=1 Tax=Novosphingobium sp. TaxID=1874826 RepID=UPI0025DB6D42|nr:DUF3667 domain-containing protein [Novosphingobium sp.]MCC6926239.1 DUF3667 domain-containing protein [Novosphingobium sp.]